MPDLPPFARISAAIEKLERLKAESTPGPWVEWHSNTVDDSGEVVPDEELSRSELEPFYAPPVTGCFLIQIHDHSTQRANADLIVTLHRTIDAQIRLLREMEHLHKQGLIVEGETFVTDDLASAILGGES